MNVEQAVIYFVWDKVKQSLKEKQLLTFSFLNSFFIGVQSFIFDSLSIIFSTTPAFDLQLKLNQQLGILAGQATKVFSYTGVHFHIKTEWWGSQPCELHGGGGPWVIDLQV